MLSHSPTCPYRRTLLRLSISLLTPKGCRCSRSWTLEPAPSTPFSVGISSRRRPFSHRQPLCPCPQEAPGEPLRAVETGGSGRIDPTGPSSTCPGHVPLPSPLSTHRFQRRTYCSIIKPDNPFLKSFPS